MEREKNNKVELDSVWDGVIKKNDKFKGFFIHNNALHAHFKSGHVLQIKYLTLENLKRLVKECENRV